jgi:trimeric autotransporter adhesin
MKLFLAAALLSSIAFGQHKATLTWTDTQNPSGTTYNVWRLTGTCPSPGPSTTPPAGFTQINTAPITAMTYTDTSVVAATAYCYVGTAVGPNGQSAPSNTAGATIPGAFPVTGLSAVNNGASNILTWTDTLNPSGTTYNAWRLSGQCPATPLVSPPAGFTQLNTSPITTKTYTDSAVTLGDAYCYDVTALGPTGPQSAPSTTSGATVPASFPMSGFGIMVE